MTALQLNTERLAQLPRLSSAAERIEISAEFYDLLAKATRNEVFQAIIESLSAIVLQRVEERRMNAMPDLLAHRRRLIGFLANHDVVCTENLNPGVVMMKSAEYRVRTDDSSALNRARDRRIFIQ